MKRRDVLKALIIAPAAPAVIAKAMEAKPAVMEFHLDHISSLSRRFGPVLIEPSPPLPNFSDPLVRAELAEIFQKYWDRYGHNYYEPVQIGDYIIQTQS